MARKNKMFSDVAEQETKLTNQTTDNDIKSTVESANASSVDMLESAEELAEYIEEVEELRKYKDMYLKLQKEYDELLEKLNEVSYKVAQQEEKSADNSVMLPTHSNNRFVRMANAQMNQYHRSVNYTNKTNYKNNGYKNWN